MHSPRIVFAAGLLLLCASTAVPEPRPRPAEYQLAVGEVLEGAETRVDIDRSAGIEASSCIPNSQTTELCQWSLRDRESGWQALATAIHTRDRVSLVCELPRDGSQRAKDSCRAYPQRTNRAMFARRKPGPSRNGKGRRSTSSALSDKENQEVAQAWLEGARTLREMSLLMGAIPSICEPARDGERTCIWRATAKTYGHGTIGASIAAGGSKKVRLHCRFPIDGSPRTADSCEAMIGS